jgi:hypothetical protein
MKMMIFTLTQLIVCLLNEIYILERYIITIVASNTVKQVLFIHEKELTNLFNPTQ